MYDIIIVGGGPAGVTAAIYALRANKKVLLLEKEVIGGKIVSSPLVENYPGIKEIKGAELSEELYKQVTDFGGEIQMKKVVEIKDLGKTKQVITEKETFEGYSVILAVGTKYKMLGLEKEEELIGKGISFCAICDGFFFKNKKVVVIGGGNTAVANALELAKIAQKVYVIQLTDHLTAEPILVNQLQEEKKIEVCYQTIVKRWIGETKLAAIEIEKQGKSGILEVEGAFLAIGQIPETEIKIENIQMDQEQYIVIKEDGSTNQAGIFAAGDCVHKKIRQLTTAVSDGTIAGLNAVEYVEKTKEIEK